MIIGLGYKARSGKDTIANYLKEVYGFKKIGFADALKEACRQIFDFNDAQLYGNEKEVVDSYWNLTPRYILQFVGTECMRDRFNKDIWVKAVEKKILSAPGNWVITDVRFLNEAAAVQRWKGFLVKVVRPQAGASSGIIAHPSEVSMDNFDEWDYTLQNDVQVHAALYGKVEEMFEYLKESGVK